MTEHLPECWAKHESDPEAWCICDELRACEERVRSNPDWRSHIPLDEDAMTHDRLCYANADCEANETYLCDLISTVREDERSNNFTPDDHSNGMTEAYQRGLDAAREAVESIPAPYKVAGDHSTYGSWHEGKADFKDLAISAIDGLRKGSLECVWPDECQPACKGCVRMEELLNERRDGYAEALEWMESIIASYTDRGDMMRVADALAEINYLRGDLLLPARADGIIAESMRMATNLSLGKATAGSVVKFLAASPPDCPVTVSPDGVFLVVLDTPA